MGVVGGGGGGGGGGWWLGSRNVRHPLVVSFFLFRFQIFKTSKFFKLFIYLFFLIFKIKKNFFIFKCFFSVF